jgi:hypothetical protein
MTKVDGHAAGDLLIPSRVGLVYSMNKKGGAEFATFSSQWEARDCFHDQ